MKYAVIALLLAAMPALAAPAQTGAPPDEMMQDASIAFQTWSGASTIYIKQMNAFYKAYDAQRAEIAQLKDELAKAKASPPVTAPSPMSTPGPKP